MQTVLIIEDHPHQTEIYATALDHRGYHVLSAKNGEEGVRIAREQIPDLILMDVALPKMDGWEATQRLKRDPSTAEIPIIALTAHAMEEDRERAEAVGCDGYLSKPIEPARVLGEVQRFLGETPEAEEA